MTLQELQSKADIEANRNRIKLNFISKAFNSLAQAYHELLRFNAGHREIKYSDCEFQVCKSNYEVYMTLGEDTSRSKSVFVKCIQCEGTGSNKDMTICQICGGSGQELKRDKI